MAMLDYNGCGISILLHQVINKDFYILHTVPLDLNLTLVRIYVLASANTFPSSSEKILVSKGSMLSSKGNMLSYMILLAIELDMRTQ